MTEPHRTTIASLPGSRFSLFGGRTPADNPNAQFSVHRTGGKLYFLNHTARVLDKVTNSSVGLVRTDDEGHGAATSEFTISYEMVQPGEAVLIDEFDDYWDADSVVATYIDVQIDGESESFSIFAKGGSGSKVLKKII